MAILKNDYASGNLFTAGDTTGVSGINDITNRINVHTHDGTDTPFISQQTTYGSGIQSPISYFVDNVDNFTNISGISISLNARGKPFMCLFNGVFLGDSVNVDLGYKMTRSGTTAGESESFFGRQNTEDADVAAAISLNWIDIPASGTDQVVYKAEVKQPGDVSLESQSQLGSVYMSVFELT